MPTSKLKEVYSMLAEWETQAKELAQNEFLSEAHAKLEERAKQLFEGIAFDQLGEEVEEDETVDTGATEAVTPLDAELSLATGEAPMDEPLPTETTVDASAEFGWDDPAVSVAKDGNDDTVITIDAASLGAAVTAGNPDTAPAADGECTCPIHGNGNAATAGLEGEPQIKSDNEVIDMTQEPDMDAILESFIALSENADENQVEIVSEADESLEEDENRRLAASFQNRGMENRAIMKNNADKTKAGVAGFTQQDFMKDGVKSSKIASNFRKASETPTGLNESEMEELTEEELAELDESMDTDSMMKALQEAFMGVQSGSGFVNESDDDDDDFDDDDDDNEESKFAQSEIGKKLIKAKGKTSKMDKYDLGDLDESCKEELEEGCDELEEGMGKIGSNFKAGENRATTAGFQNAAAQSRREGGDNKAHSAAMTKDAEKNRKAGGKQVLPEEEELEEANQRTLANGKNQTLKPQSFPKDRKRSGLSESQNLLLKLGKKVEAVLAENARLKSENKEMATLNEGLETKFTAATGKLQEVKGKLYEASIIASKSTCMNKLMLEHVTTQDEKINIVESFQKAVSRAEVQNLFEKFDKSFKKGATVQLNEGKNIFSKLNPLFKSETNNQEVLNESAAYDNAFTKRMDQLIQHNGKK